MLSEFANCVAQVEVDYKFGECIIFRKKLIFGSMSFFENKILAFSLKAIHRTFKKPLHPQIDVWYELYHGGIIFKLFL